MHQVLLEVSQLSLAGATEVLVQVRDGFGHPTTVSALVAVFVIAHAVVFLWAAGKLSWRARREVQQLEVRGERSFPIGDGPDDELQLVWVVDDAAPFAFTHGFSRPRIYVSTGLLTLLTKDEVEAVVHHEHAHALRGDPLRLLVARSLACCLRLVPGAASLQRAYACRLEISADAAAVKAMRNRTVLASALHRLLSVGPATPISTAVGISPADVRIDRLLGKNTSLWDLYEAPTATQVLLFAGLTLLVAFGVLGSAHSISACLAATGVGSTC